MKLLWCDDFTRLDPLTAKALEADAQEPMSPPVTLAAGRNEFASFQLTAGPIPKGATVTVSARELKGPGGARLPAGAADIFVAWYSRAEDKWYPEVLVPQDIAGGSSPAFRARNGVKGQRFAGFWVDLFVPADAKPGCYAGAVVVQAGKESVKVPVEIQVHAARLSADCCLDVSMNNYVDVISRGWPKLRGVRNPLLTDMYRRVERGTFRTAHDHRMIFHYLPYGHSGYVAPTFAPPIEGEGPRKHVTSWTDWDRHFGGYFDGSAFRGTRRGPVPVKRFYTPLNLCWPADFLKFGQPGYEAEWRAVGGQMVDHFRAKGWTKTRFDMFLNHKQRFRFFPWDTEEARFIEDNDLHRYFRKLWEGTFDRKSTKPVTFDYTLGTTWTYGLDIQSDLAEFIDVFIGGTSGAMWYKEITPRLHRNGRQILPCSNSGCMTDSTRAAAFTPLKVWMLDCDGYMPRWSTTMGWGDDPYRRLPDRGGTTFLYPGAEFGSEETFASLRLKVQRNALQMVDRFQNAAAGRGGKPAVRRQVNQALRIADKSWYAKRPDYVDRKLPKDWTNADFATEEPALAGWSKFSAPQFRTLNNLALKLASGEKA